MHFLIIITLLLLELLCSAIPISRIWLLNLISTSIIFAQEKNIQLYINIKIIYQLTLIGAERVIYDVVGNIYL